MAPSSPPARRLVVGGVPEHFNLPWKLAVDAGAFAAAGLEVTWVDEPSGSGAIVAALAAGTLDLATVLTEGIVAAADRGLDVRHDRLYVESPLWWGIHVPPSRAGATDLARLPHDRIAISRPGSGSQLMAYELAAREGWRIGPASFVPVGTLAGGVDALEAGDADVFLWETFMTKPAVDAGRCARVGEIPTPWPAFVVAARRDVPVARERAACRVVERVARDLVADPDRAAVVARHIGIAEADAAAWFERTRFAHDRRASAAELDAVRARLRLIGAA